MRTGDKVKFVLGTGYSTGTVVDVNEATVRVKLENGIVVKRHMEKHRVWLDTAK